MRNYLKEYVIKIDDLIKEKQITNEVYEEHLNKIKFFQHERLIHLLVTLFYGMFLFISVYISTILISFIAITFLGQVPS